MCGTPESPSFSREALELQPQEAAEAGRFVQMEQMAGETSAAWRVD